ncbi:MAG TPA: glycosyltransferase family 87 protein [Planctomycetota bacterium]|nr:glycosyltransferase family 87 protein [Planctomycetota bacterium]
MNWKRGLTLGAMALVAGATVLVYARRPGSDFHVYVASGEAVLQGKDIYRAPLPAVNTGPPFFSLFCVVPALLDRVSPVFSRGAWTLLNGVALVLILHLSSRLIHGRRLPIASAPVLLPLLLTLPYLLYHFQYHQVNLIVFALTLGGMTLQEEGKESLGGVLVGAGAALKVMPILFVPYLVYRRRWVAALSALAAAVVLTLSPSLLMGWDRFSDSFRYWLTILPHNPLWDAGDRNQSVLAMWDRYLGHGCIPLVSPGVVTLEMSGAPIVRMAWMATVVITGLFMLLAFRGPLRRGSMGAVAEWSALFVVSAIFGPVAWKHYLVVLILPNMLLYQLWRSHPDGGTRRIAGAFLWGCFLLCLSSTRNLLPGAWCMRVGMASNLTLAALTMGAGLLWLRRRLSSGERSEETPSPQPTPGAGPA